MNIVNNFVNLQISLENGKLQHDAANIRLSEPQPPEIELVDIFKEPTFKMKQLEEMIKDEVVSLFLHKSSPTESDGTSNIFSSFRLLHFIILISTSLLSSPRNSKEVKSLSFIWFNIHRQGYREAFKKI